MSNASFFWHDYETSGTDPRRDRPVQFAGQRTTLDLQPIGDPISIYCQPSPDILPQPAACLITGITPQFAQVQGTVEAQFAAHINEQLATPGTCSVGYNSLRFDDEFTRNLLYRNFFDPYEREWKNGNSRWDLIDLARMCYALRPLGIEWPRRDNGDTSFRLEDLTAANRIVHARAHDALSDVNATIELARLLRVRQPRLFEYYFALRRKQRAFELLDYVRRTPLLHVSSRYMASKACLAMIAPLAAHPMLPNGVIVYDLDVDPSALIQSDADEIADRVFTPRADLPEDVERIALKTVHANKSPALAPMSALNGVDVARIGLDIERGMKHLHMLADCEGLTEKLRQVFSLPRDVRDAQDPELSLYAAFASDADRNLCREVRKSPPDALATRNFAFKDARFTELLWRYRARNYPQTLASDEAQRWNTFCHTRLHLHSDATGLSLQQYFEEIARLRRTVQNDGAKLALLDQLEVWGRDVMDAFGPPA